MKRKIFAAGSRGFTLLELIISVAIAAMVSGGAFAIYSAQQTSYLREEQFVEVQQNMRAAMYFMERDIHSSGFDPNSNTLSGFSEAKVGRIAVRRSSDDALYKGCYDCTKETVIYGLTTDSDTTPDGIAGTGTGPVNALANTSPLYKATYGPTTTPTTPPATIPVTAKQAVIDNVEAVEFFYHLRNGNSVTAVATADLRNILSVDVTLLIRSRNSIKGYTSPYTSSAPLVTPGGQQWVPATAYSHYLHYMLTTNIQCRNLGFREIVE